MLYRQPNQSFNPDATSSGWFHHRNAPLSVAPVNSIVRRYMQIVQISHLRSWLALIAICATVACVGCLRPQTVANCKINGKIEMEGSGEPVPNVMIFVQYSFNKDIGSNKEPLTIGPIFSDQNGEFIISPFYKKQWYFETLWMGDCGGHLIFIHRHLGMYSRSICTEDFPPNLQFKTLKITQHKETQKWSVEQIKFTYTAISTLPAQFQNTALQHIDPAMRPKDNK